MQKATLHARLLSFVKHCLDFSFVFQLPYLREETCFQQARPSAVESISQAVGCTGFF